MRGRSPGFGASVSRSSRAAAAAGAGSPWRGRAPAASAPRPAPLRAPPAPPPAARRAARHRPRGGGVSAPGAGSALAPPRRPPQLPLAPVLRLHRPRLKAPRRVRRPAPPVPCPLPPARDPRPGRSRISTRDRRLSGRPRLARRRSDVPKSPPLNPDRRLAPPGRAAPRVARSAQPPPRWNPPAEGRQSGYWPRGRHEGSRGWVRPPPGHHFRLPRSRKYWWQEFHLEVTQVPVPAGRRGSRHTWGGEISVLAATAFKAPRLNIPSSPAGRFLTRSPSQGWGWREGLQVGCPTPVRVSCGSCE